MPAKTFEAEWKSYTSRKGEPLSTTTINTYRAAMNKVAQFEGYTTKDEVLANQAAFIKALEARETDKVKRRHVYSALNRILDHHNVPMDKRTKLYEGYKRTQED